MLYLATDFCDIEQMDPTFPYVEHSSESILLGNDVAQFAISGTRPVEAPCKITFSIRRFPTVLVELENDEDISIGYSEITAHLLKSNVTFSAIPSSLRADDGHFIRVLQPNPDILEVGSTEDISTMSWLIYNGPWLWEANSQHRATFEVGGWYVSIEPPNRQPVLKCIESPIHKVTHRAVMRHADNSLFRPASGVAMAQLVRYFLSFVAGHWTGLALIAGLDAKQELVFEQWTSLHVDPPPHNQFGWYDRGVTLHELAPGFIRRLQDGVWGAPFLDAMYWYLVANNQGTRAEAGLMVAQAALELLSWTLLVLDRKTVTPSRFKKIRSATKISWLFDELQIPRDIPPQLRELQASPARWKGAQDAITAIRNDLVHPEKRGHEHLAYEAWQLAQWFIELVIFRLSDYNGKYSNRTV